MQIVSLPVDQPKAGVEQWANNLLFYMSKEQVNYSFFYLIDLWTWPQSIRSLEMEEIWASHITVSSMDVSRT